MRVMPLVALVAAAALGACSGDGEQEPENPGPRERPSAPAVPDGGVREGHGADPRERPSAPAVPDGGVREGHGAEEDDAPPPRERGSIVVPESDRTPPRPVVRLEGARATLDRGAPRVLVSKDEPIAVRVAGRDRDGGMGRARVAIRARLTCRSQSGELVTQPFVRYVPPPQVVRIRIAPGTRTRTELRQAVTQSFDCRGGTLQRLSGEVWADTTNASGLDATSKHIRFASR